MTGESSDDDTYLGIYGVLYYFHYMESNLVILLVMLQVLLMDKI